MNASREQVVQALKEKRITAKEADAYLHHIHETTLEDVKHKPHWYAYAAILFIIALVTLGVLYQAPTLTGLVTFDQLAGNVTNTSIPINATITGLRVSGTMYGEGNATLVLTTDGGVYDIAFIESDTGVPRTVQPSYVPNETIDIEHAPEQATYYIDDGVDTIVVDMPFAAPEVGTYDILVLGSGNISITRVPLIVSETSVLRQTTFANLCEETCVLPPTNGTLNIMTDGVIDVEMHLELLIENQEPVLVVPFENLVVSAPIVINLSGHFVDPEGEELMFSTSQSDYVVAVVEDSILTITPASAGEELFLIYASDLESLVQAQFTITVNLNETNITETNVTNATNETPVNDTEINETQINVTETNITNQTINVTELNITNGTLRCDHPNPNLRPVECLQSNTTDYFVYEDIFWENSVRTKVAKFNQIGNLLITGDIVEYSVFEPGAGDFRIGDVDRDGDLRATIWIDGDTGNLHLRGRLSEEVLQMAPPPGSYSVITKRSIYLAWADLNRGDLFIRGNVIPYRRQIE